GVVFGPVSDWGKGSCKLLLEHNKEGGLIHRRQYTLENVTSWAVVPEFGEKGMEALGKVVSNTEDARKVWSGEGDWFRYISQLERDHRGEEETLRVTDETSAGRAIEILNRAVAFQDSVANGDLDGAEISYETMEKDGDLLESITVRPPISNGEATTHHWVLTTPKHARRARATGTASVQLRQEESKREAVAEKDDGESDNETIRAMSTRKGKKARIGTYLSELEKNLGSRLVEPAVPRTFEQVKDNLFQATPGTMDWAEDEIPDLDVDLNRPPVKGLKDSQHAIRSLTEEEVREMTERLVEGQGKRADEEEDEEMGYEEGDEERRKSWLRIHETRSEMEVVEAIIENARVLAEVNGLKREERSWRSKEQGELARGLIIMAGRCIEGGWYSDGVVEGKGGWKALIDHVLGRNNIDREEVKSVIEARMLWKQASEFRTGPLKGLEKEVREAKEQLAFIAVVMGAGTVEEQAKAKKTMNARQGKVDEEKRKGKELKKIDARKKEVEAEKKREEKAQKEAEDIAAKAKSVLDSQQKAWDSCKETLIELRARDRTGLNDDELIDLTQKMKEAKEMQAKIEKETSQLVERRVGNKRQVVGGEVFKIVEVVMGHTRDIDGKGKAELEAAVEEVNKLLRESALTENRKAWTVTAKAGVGEFKDESIWTVSKVSQDIEAIKVAGEVGKLLVAVFGCKGDILNVWAEEGKSVKMIAPAVLITIARGRYALAQKLREENKDLKGGKRMPKLWGGAKVTGFTFDAADAAEASKLIKKGLIWDGKKRKVAIFEQGRSGQETSKTAIEQAANKTVATPVGPRGWKPALGPQRLQYQSQARGSQVGSLRGYAGRAQITPGPLGYQGQSNQGRQASQSYQSWGNQSYLSQGSQSYMRMQGGAQKMMSGVQCHNCGGWGHAAAGKIARKTEEGRKGKGRKVDEEGFVVVEYKKGGSRRKKVREGWVAEGSSKGPAKW
ncbi:hypothetical protein EV426DRAFT_606304, partial [Tirmania nivea]